MSELISLFKTFIELKTSFEAASENIAAVSQFNAGMLESDMKEAYKKLKLAIISELRVEHDFYQKIHQQNMLLMHNQQFELKVTKIKTADGAFDKFSTRFEGGILSNGYLYFRSTETNSDFTLDSYASYLKGSLDEHGAGEIAHTDTEIALLLTLPSLYEAKIALDGTIFLQVTELDPTLERKLIAFELTGDPFNRSEKKRK